MTESIYTTREKELYVAEMLKKQYPNKIPIIITYENKIKDEIKLIREKYLIDNMIQVKVAVRNIMVKYNIPQNKNVLCGRCMVNISDKSYVTYEKYNKGKGILHLTLMDENTFGN